MKRQVGIFIETNPLQLDNEFTKLELFNDEKISVTSTIQNISDISKIFTDFSQGFTIPCSPTNNAIFQHFYQNDVDASISYQFRFNAFIEIDTILFRRGKIQFEKANIKNGKADSYSVTFYGAGVSLKDHFLEDKLSQLNYSTLDHNYTNTEVYNRVTIDSSVTDYDVRYPLITSNRVWQFGSSDPLPTANLPNWYDYPASNVNNIGDNAGRIFYNELFPAVRVASIFDIIQAEYGITFNGIFLQTDFFRKAFLLYKNKESYHYTNNPIDLNFNTSSNTLASAFNLGQNSFKPIQKLNYSNSHFLQYTVVSLTGAPVDYFIDVYKNGIFFIGHSGTTTGTAPQFEFQLSSNDIITFKIRSYLSTTVGINIVYKRISATTNLIGSITDYNIEYGQCSATAVTTSFTDLAGLAPDLKISDFITGICKEFNLTVYSNTKNVFTFDPIPYWYSKGAITDITKYTDITSIEIERMKLYKSIEFKYQDSECMLNKFFLENPTNPDGHGYGNIKVGYDYDGGEYKIESPFENLLHNNFGNQLQVGYCLNKELAPYIPQPVLLYMNNLATLTGGDRIHWDGQTATDVYVPFGQDTEIITTEGLVPVSLNFSADISSFYNVANQNSIFALYYQDYLSNLYNQKNRLVKVQTILPVSILTSLQLNDRLIIRDKRYMINEMQSDLTTGDVSFTLISDFAPVVPIKFEDTPTGSGNTLRFAILFTNGANVVDITKSANASNVTLSNAKFTSEGYLDVTVPTNVARTITLTLTTSYINRNTDTNYIIINQV